MGRLLALFLTLLAAVPGAAASRATDEILAALQGRIETGGEVDDLVARLIDLPLAELKTLQVEFDRAWAQVRDGYLSAFEDEAGKQHSGDRRQASAALVGTLRDDFHRVRTMAEGPMKEALKKTSRPALTRLEPLLLPSPSGILGTAGEPLRQQRRGTLTMARFRDGLLTAMVSFEESDNVAMVHAAEARIAEEFSGLAREGLRIMRANRKEAEAAGLPEAERRGIEELNTMRLLVGVSALRLDPKLCEAARGHSGDMHARKFFAHTSPVEGKRTPADRARLAGTTGSGENIYKGSGDPQGANRGWFFSPGHHKNMFNPGYGRVGLGHAHGYWTQMFGGPGGR